jgi:hypothetical protein
VKILAKYCSKKGGKKGKKGKKAAAASVDSTDDGSGESLKQAQAAFKDTAAAVLGMFEKLLKRCTVPASGLGEVLSIEHTSLPILQGEGAKWGQTVHKKIQTSHELTLGRLKTLLQDKLGLMRSL